MSTFQKRVDEWVTACFGEAIRSDKIERNHRFLEEALELVQATGCTQSEAHQLVDYVFGRPAGEIEQEVGGVMNTLAALCNIQGVDIMGAQEVELARCWVKIEKIRAKQAAKPKHSPLPEQVQARQDGAAGQAVGGPGGVPEALAWLECEVSAVSCRYQGDPAYDHDAYWMKDRVKRLIEDARTIFAPTPPATASDGSGCD